MFPLVWERGGTTGEGQEEEAGSIETDIFFFSSSLVTRDPCQVVCVMRVSRPSLFCCFRFACCFCALCMPSTFS